VKILGDKYFIVDIGSRLKAVSVDNLKPHLGTSPIAPALSPRHGQLPQQQQQHG
jgi:hypothetical protein